MKNFTIFNQLTAMPKRLAMVLTVLFTIGVGSVWGKEVTILANQITGFGSGSNYTSSSITIGDITISSNSGFSTTQFRIAKSKNLTLSCSAGKMTKIVFTASGTSYKLNADGITWNSTTGTFTNASGVESITFTNSANNIARITKIVITYNDSDPCASLEAPNVTETNITTTSFTLSWDAVDEATSYNVYNYTTDEAYDEITKTSYTFNGLEPNTEYEWEVESVYNECFSGTSGTTTTSQEQCSISWLVNDEAASGSPTTKVDKNGKVTTLPTTPTLDCSGKVFVGWSNQEVTDGNKPSVLFSTAANSPEITKNTTFYAVFAESGGTGSTSWEKTDISGISSSDVVVITMSKSGVTYAMKNNGGTSNPPGAEQITIDENKISSTVHDTYKWNISNSSGNLTIYPDGTTSKWLYCTDTNNGVRVGSTNTNKTFTISGNYLKHTGTSRYVGVYIANPDWRCYDNTQGNIVEQTLAFYKKTTTGGYQNYTTECSAAEPTQLATPTNLQVTYISCTGAILTWNNVENNNGYLLSIKNTSSGTSFNSNIAKDATSGTPTLNPGTTYTWTVKAKGDGTNYLDSEVADGGSFTTNYSITYEENGGDAVADDCRKALPNPLPTTSRDGYQFVDWYTDQGLTTVAVAGAAITQNTILYAKWEETLSSYTITYVANGGTKVDPISDVTALPNPLPETTRDHYTFAGWYTDESCEQVAVAGATITSNTTLYAKWTPITYTVTFDAGSGTCTTKSTTGNYEDGITTLPTATPCDYASTSGWSFVGWSETTVSETTVRPAIHTGNYKPTNTITLHAVYAKTGTAEGAAGEFILSLEYGSTTYYVGQTFDNSKLSAETDRNNAARFTIEDNYLHYEGGYISHVATQSSPNITRQANKEDAQAWTIAENGNTITFTSTADATRGLGFNYNDGSPRFAAYKLNEKDGETIKYPSTFTKTSVSGGNVQVTTYNSNPSCEAPVDPTWVDATINFEGIIQVECGSKTLLNAADPNGPATISFNGYDLQNSVTVTASNGFLISTDKVNDAGYKSEVTINPHKEGQNIGKLQNVYVIAQAPAQSGNFTGTITLTGADITGGSQVINITADVTCTTYTITWSVDGDTELIDPTTFYAGGDWILPENPTYECNGREFVGWTTDEILQPQDVVPNTLYKKIGDFPTIEGDETFYAVFAKAGNSGTTTVTDVLNRTTTGISSGAGYGTWSGKKAESSAVYAGQSAGGNDAIQLRSSTANNIYSGIVTTSSGGKATKITVVWNSNTAINRTLDIYGKNSAYTSATNLYNANDQGTKLGTIVNGTSIELIINGEYEYIGIRSNDAALYLTSISIDWETDDVGGEGSANYTSYTTSCADIKGIRIEGPTTTTFNEGDKFFFDGKVYAINNDDSETDVTNSPNLRFVCDMHKTGTQTVTVNYLGKSATYEITINAVDKWKITWNVSGATNTGLGPIQVAKGTAIGALPQPKSIPAGCTGKAFVGWTESNEVNYDGNGITFITSETVPSANTTYYAVFATPSGDAGDGDYVKVTENIADFSGEYLIVYEDGPVAFNGGLNTLDTKSNTISISINNATIESNATTNAAKFTIAQRNEGGYSIKSASGRYIGRTADENELDESTSTVYANTISVSNGEANIIGSGGAYLRYNKASDQTRFRYYKSTTYAGQQPIALYKKSNSYASYTDYTTGCHDCTITYYGFKGGYSTQCSGSDLNVFTQRVNSSHTIPNCGEITDPTTLGRTFLNSWKDQNGKTYAPGETFILTEDIILYAQWALYITGNLTLPTNVEDLANTDVIVHGGNTLTLAEGTTTIKSLTLKGGIQSDGKYQMPNVWIPEGATLVRKDTKIYLDLIVNADNYYPFAVPFATKNDNNVDYLDPVLNEASTYSTHFVIKTYNGAARANKGEDRENNWVKVNRETDLQPGVGYIITAMTYPDKDTATIRIPMTVSNDWFANGEQVSITVNETTTTRNTVAVTAHSGTASQAVNGKRHAGWNFVASPYLSKFAGNNIDNEGNLTYINGAIHINGEFAEGGEDVPYVTVPAYDFSYYMSHKLSEVVLNPEWSFFVQIGTDGTMNFTTAGRQQAPAALRANAPAENPRIEANLAILSNEVEADHTGLIIDDRYTSDYEIGADLEKMFGSAYNTTIYTIGNSTRLAYNALPHSQAQLSIPLGFRAAEDGEYTISLTNYEEITGVESIILHDLYTDIKTNLLHLDYNFYTDQTQDDNRFVVYLVPRNNTTTNLSTIIDEAQNSENRKVLINNHLYIIHNGKVYNGAGQIVK